MDITEAIIADVDNKATVDAISAARESATIHLTKDMAFTVEAILAVRVHDTMTALADARAQVAPRAFDGDWDAELTDDNEVGLLVIAMNHRMARDAHRMWCEQVLPSFDEYDDPEY